MALKVLAFWHGEEKGLTTIVVSPLISDSAGGGNRTHTLLPELDFESSSWLFADIQLAINCVLENAIGPTKTGFWELCNQLRRSYLRTRIVPTTDTTTDTVRVTKLN